MSSIKISFRKRKALYQRLVKEFGLPHEGASDLSSSRKAGITLDCIAREVQVPICDGKDYLDLGRMRELKKKKDLENELKIKEDLEKLNSMSNLDCLLGQSGQEIQEPLQISEHLHSVEKKEDPIMPPDSQNDDKDQIPEHPKKEIVKEIRKPRGNRQKLTTSVQLSPEQMEMLKEIAAQDDRSIASVIRIAVRYFLESRKK
jgi:RNAse (barnase) inhibitor barstar